MHFYDFVLANIYSLSLTVSMTYYIWMQNILHSLDMRILKEKGWFRCPGKWCFVMLALVPCFEITKKFHTWTSEFPFWSQAHTNILQTFFPYDRITEWLGLEGISKPIQFHPLPWLGTHQLRLPRVPSNVALSTSRDGAPQLLWAAIPAPHRPLSEEFLPTSQTKSTLLV